MPDEPHERLTRDLIVIGGSSGALEALTLLVANLPRDLEAAVCVVVHRPAYVRSSLPEILARAGPLPAVSATQAMHLEPGRIYIAVADHHLLVERTRGHRRRIAPGGPSLGTLRVTRGPKENRARPAIDPLFRSAALSFGPRVIGVLLSGALDDGTAGLWAIRDQGGLAVVQDPNDAAMASMPASALTEVGADHVARGGELGTLLGRLTRLPIDAGAVASSMSAANRTDELRREVAMAAIDDDTHERPERYGVPSRFACPDCSGSLWDTSNGRGPIRLRCSVGHAYSPAGLAEAQNEQIEHGLWAAVRALEDKAAFARLRAARATDRGLPAIAVQYEAEVEATLAQAAAIRGVLRLDTSSVQDDSEDVDVDTGDAGIRDRGSSTARRRAEADALSAPRHEGREAPT